jgi:predicted nucleotidyltransferase
MRVQDKTQLFDLLLRHQAHLNNLGVKRLGVFGSFARGDQTEGSDVDILVEFQSDQKSFDNFMNTALFLEETFGRKVELVTPESLSPYIGPHVLREVEYASISS